MRDREEGGRDEYRGADERRARYGARGGAGMREPRQGEQWDADSEEARRHPIVGRRINVCASAPHGHAEQPAGRVHAEGRTETGVQQDGARRWIGEPAEDSCEHRKRQ
jgi:hypothetical protein